MSRNTVVGNSHLFEGRFARYVKRHLGDLRREGLPALLRKSCEFLLIVLSLPVVLLVRMVRPVKLIRFGALHSERIGHFAANTELYLCERDTGRQDSLAFDVFFHAKRVSNHQLKIMWDRTLKVCKYARVLDRANRLLWGGQSHVVPMPRDWDIHGLFPRTKVHLCFTSEEDRRGREGLRKLGIPEGMPFVCFHARDRAYLEKMLPIKSWRYHDYRDSSVHNYIPAAEELARRGYYVMRMGAVVSEKIVTTDPRIIDYATNGRSDFLDIYLGAKCNFFIGDTAGIFAVPKVFRRPMAAVNIVPLAHASAFGRADIFIPKKLWVRGEKRLLTFREILASGADRWNHTEMYMQAGVEIIENTADEILALTREICERLEGRWNPHECDDELQGRFWAVLPPRHPLMLNVVRPRVGAEFLRQNLRLLD